MRTRGAAAGTSRRDAAAPPLVLASSSPRRRRLLRRLGVAFTVSAPDVDERPRQGEPPRAHARRLAAAKARAVARGLRCGLVVGADTVVALDGRILGKPSGPRDAARMLAFLSGRTHRVYTGVAVAPAPSGRVLTAVACTRVSFRRLDREQIRRYVASGEPRDKAGAYAVQGRGRRLVAKVEGSLSNVVGLPLETLAELLRRCGVGIPAPPA